MDGYRNTRLVNLAHLNRLYEEIEIEGQEMAIIHIYSEYPDYRWVEATGEGIACVDDAARAAIVYLRHYEYTGQEVSLQHVKKLLRFILFMQSERGTFYNFIYRNYQINRQGDTSRDKLDWWTWRAQWALAESLTFFKERDPQLAALLGERLLLSFEGLDSMLQRYPQKVEFRGLSCPAWLPHGAAADQGAIILKALLAFYKAYPSIRFENQINKLAQGLVEMALGDSVSFPYGMHLSWRNLWHAWGNSAAMVLLQAGQLFQRRDYISNALREIRNFYPYLMNKQYRHSMRFLREDDQLYLLQEEQFPQIAYDIRPMVMASLKAYEITGEEQYARQAGEIATWLFGGNITGKAMYDIKTGRCYDGILGPEEININSGAESTIEALMTLMAVEDNQVAFEIVRDYIGLNRKGSMQ